METRPCAGRGWLKARSERFAVEKERIFSLPVLRLRLDEARRGGRRAEITAYAAAEFLRRTGCREILFREDFPFKEELAGFGFREPDDMFLRRVTAARAARFCTRDIENPCAAVYARRFIGPARSALLALCRDFRSVLAEAELEGQSAVRAAVRESGAAAVTRITEQGARRASVALLFAGPARRLRFSDDCTVIPLEEGAAERTAGGRLAVREEFIFPADMLRDIPLGYPPEPIVSAAVGSGVVRAGRISLKRLETRPNTGDGQA